MSRVFIFSSFVLIMNFGCIDHYVPFPQRLPDEQQSKLTDSWGHMVSMGDEVDWTTLADAVMLHRLWHVGVDALELRSVKNVPSGQVVMETHFDRSKPDEDVFTITYLDLQGQAYRSTSYSASELRALANDYLVSDREKIPEETDEAYADRMARVSEMNARRARVQEVFPPPPQDETDQSPEEIPASPGQQ